VSQKEGALIVWTAYILHAARITRPTVLHSNYVYLIIYSRLGEL
jgi:hypothetical protein